MRLVDADKLFPDVMKVDGSMAISQGQLAHAHTIEAISKADYETRLKADMVAMLTEIQLEIEETVKEEELIDKKWANGLHYSEKIIQQKIDALKEVVEDGKA